MRKLFLLLGFLILFVSCKNPLLGKWERFGDDSEGSIIEIVQNGSELEARLVKVTGKLVSLGFEEEEVKWKEIKLKSGNKCTFLDFYKVMYEGSVVNSGYIESYFIVSNDGVLETFVAEGKKGKSGEGDHQKWRKIIEEETEE